MASVAKGMKGIEQKSGEQYARMLAKEILVGDLANRDWIDKNIYPLPAPGQ